MWKNFGVNSLRNVAILYIVNITFVHMRGQHCFLCCWVKDDRIFEMPRKIWKLQ